MKTIEEQRAELRDAKDRLTMLFIGGRRPSDAEMVEVETLRDRVAELESDLRSDITGCKS